MVDYDTLLLMVRLAGLFKQTYSLLLQSVLSLLKFCDALLQNAGQMSALTQMTFLTMLATFEYALPSIAVDHDFASGIAQLKMLPQSLPAVQRSTRCSQNCPDLPAKDNAYTLTCSPVAVDTGTHTAWALGISVINIHRNSAQRIEGHS